VGASYFVYYRVDPACAADGRARVDDLLARLARSTGVRGRLLRKCGEPLLWMEVYEAVGDQPGFEAALARAGEEVGIETLLAAGAQRKVECFRP
jgi:hypothetical protein